MKKRMNAIAVAAGKFTKELNELLAALPGIIVLTTSLSANGRASESLRRVPVAK